MCRQPAIDCSERRSTGHKTRSVFERYNIVSECDLVEAAKKLNVLQALLLHGISSGLTGRIMPQLSLAD